MSLCRAQAASNQLRMQVDAANERYSNLVQDKVDPSSALKQAAYELTQTQAVLASSQHAVNELQSELSEARAAADSERASLLHQIVEKQDVVREQRWRTCTSLELISCAVGSDACFVDHSASGAWRRCHCIDRIAGQQQPRP